MNAVVFKSIGFPASLIVLTILSAGVAHGQRKARAPKAGALDKIAETYNIKIVAFNAGFPVKMTAGRIDGRNAGKKDLQAYAQLFAQEFSLYPPQLVKRSRLKRVVFCTGLAFAGQRRNAVPDFEHDTLYLEVSRGSENSSYLRKVIHHEFYHIIDLRDDGSLYKDEKWASLNRGGFKYGSGGRNAQLLATTSVLTTRFPGFLNHYSTTAVEEDKAEMFANLIANFQYVALRARTDTVLHSKALRMKELMSKFSPEMDDKFWAKIRRIKRADR